MWVVVLESPIAYTATAGMLVYVVVRHRPIRRVVWAVLSDERTRPVVGTRALAKDVLLLHLLRRARGRQIATIAHVEPSTRGDVLRFSSRANDRPTDEHVSLEGIEHVLWSHSEVGPDVFYPIVGARH